MLIIRTEIKICCYNCFIEYSIEYIVSFILMQSKIHVNTLNFITRVYTIFIFAIKLHVSYLYILGLQYLFAV